MYLRSVHLPIQAVLEEAFTTNLPLKFLISSIIFKVPNIALENVSLNKLHVYTILFTEIIFACLCKHASQSNVLFAY